MRSSEPMTRRPGFIRWFCDARRKREPRVRWSARSLSSPRSHRGAVRIAEPNGTLRACACRRQEKKTSPASRTPRKGHRHVILTGVGVACSARAVPRHQREAPLPRALSWRQEAFRSGSAQHAPDVAGEHFTDFVFLKLERGFPTRSPALRFLLVLLAHVHSPSVTAPTTGVARAAAVPTAPCARSRAEKRR